MLSSYGVSEGEPSGNAESAAGSVEPELKGRRELRRQVFRSPDTGQLKQNSS